MRLNINMGITALVNNVQPKNITRSRPGKVGSVGEVQVRTRFRQSCPEMPWAYDPYWSGSRANKLGSNVQDGNTKSFDSHGGPANTNLKGWNGNRSFKHQYGYSIHDIQSADLASEPIASELGRFSWKQKMAKTRNVKGGSLFLPMGYTATGKPRGGLYPTATGFGGTTPASQVYDPALAPKVALDPRGPQPTNVLREGYSVGGIQPGPNEKRGVQLGQQLRDLRIF